MDPKMKEFLEPAIDRILLGKRGEGVLEKDASVDLSTLPDHLVDFVLEKVATAPLQKVPGLFSRMFSGAARTEARAARAANEAALAGEEAASMGSKMFNSGVRRSLIGAGVGGIGGAALTPRGGDTLGNAVQGAALGAGAGFASPYAAKYLPEIAGKAITRAPKPSWLKTTGKALLGGGLLAGGLYGAHQVGSVEAPETTQAFDQGVSDALGQGRKAARWYSRNYFDPTSTSRSGQVFDSGPNGQAGAPFQPNTDKLQGASDAVVERVFDQMMKEAGPKDLAKLLGLLGVAGLSGAGIAASHGAFGEDAAENYRSYLGDKLLPSFITDRRATGRLRTRSGAILGPTDVTYRDSDTFAPPWGRREVIEDPNRMSKAAPLRAHDKSLMPQYQWPEKEHDHKVKLGGVPARAIRGALKPVEAVVERGAAQEAAKQSLRSTLPLLGAVGVGSFLGGTGTLGEGADWAYKRLTDPLHGLTSQQRADLRNAETHRARREAARKEEQQRKSVQNSAATGAISGVGNSVINTRMELARAHRGDREAMVQRAQDAAHLTSGLLAPFEQVIAPFRQQLLEMGKVPPTAEGAQPIQRFNDQVRRDSQNAASKSLGIADDRVDL